MLSLPLIKQQRRLVDTDIKLATTPAVLDGAVADFTQDGYDDLALSFDHGNGVHTLQVFTPNDVNDISKGFRRGLLDVDPLSAIAAGDFKGDGNREIAGLTIPPTGGLKLEIFTVDPNSLAITLASSVALTTPDASSTAPIARVSVARGRFNSVGHDQLGVAFATNSGYTHVEVIDFTLGTLTPFEASPLPLYTPDSAVFSDGFMQIKTGKLGYRIVLTTQSFTIARVQLTKAATSRC